VNCLSIKKMKAETINRDRTIALPETKNGFNPGDEVVVITHKNRIVIIPKKQYIKENYCLLMSYDVLAKDWLSPQEDKRWDFL